MRQQKRSRVRRSRRRTKMAFPPKHTPAVEATKKIVENSANITQDDASTHFSSNTEALMAKLLGAMKVLVQEQSSGQSELNATLKTMGESLTSLNEVMSMGDVSLDNW